MAVSEECLLVVLDQLRQVTPVSSRRMFGGVGFYAGGHFFAIASGDVLYLKTDGVTVGRFTAEGMHPFRPFGPGTQAMPYHELPVRVLEDVEELGVWVKEAIDVARRAKAGKKPRRPAKRRSG